MVCFGVFTSCNKGLFCRLERTHRPCCWRTWIWFRSMLNTKAHMNDIHYSHHLYVSNCWPWKQLFLKLNSHLLIPNINFTVLIGQNSYKVSHIINTGIWHPLLTEVHLIGTEYLTHCSGALQGIGRLQTALYLWMCHWTLQVLQLA